MQNLKQDHEDKLPLTYRSGRAGLLPVAGLRSAHLLGVGALARYEWIAFIVWCLPAFWHMSRSILYDKTKGAEPWLLGAAIIASLLGSMGSLHILRHIGLACAIGGTIPFHYATVVWMMTAIAWLPGFGWMIKSLPIHIIPLIQVSLATVGSGAMIYSLRRS